jgi:hypothetical protein
MEKNAIGQGRKCNAAAAAAVEEEKVREPEDVG